ncbi:MAG: ABC transporter permease [Actinobacteria bacterium]|nr:ABC transporter permease [Actinomycetota bacterium]
MTRYIASRVLQALGVVVGVVILTFVIARLIPGDAAVAYAGRRATPEQLAAVREQFGLDGPVWQQFVTYVSGVARGDLGISLHTKEPVLSDLLRVFPTTLVLVAIALLFAAIIGIPLGIIAARSHGRIGDLITKVIAILMVSMPVFWLAILLQIIFFSRLGWLPAASAYDTKLDATSPLYTVIGVPVVDALLTGNWVIFRSTLQHLILPVIAIAAYPIGAVAMVTRGSLLENLGDEHVRMVRALGFSERSVFGRFALRPSLNPILALLALVFAYALTNSFIVESVFNWPGLGSYAVKSIQTLDVPAILGVTLIVAVMYVLLNLVVDLVQAVIDPRVRS